MALSLLSAVLGILNPLIEKEVGILWGVDKEMKKMSSTLSSIVAVLEDAERNHLQDKAIQDWLRKLKLAAYEVEDVLDECSTEVLRWESKGQSSGPLGKAGTSLLYPFENLKFRHKIGNKMKEISENLAAIADERNKFHFRNIVVAENRDEFTESRETSSLLTLPEVIGRNEDKEMIIKILLEDALERDEVSVYPIIGMGGLGKTTLVQAAFNDERMKTHFGPRIWVYVSQDFNLKRVIKSIIQSIQPGDTNQVKDLELDSAQGKLQETLNGKRYLIVLDDVWDEDQEKWNKLKYTLVCGSKGSSVIVTTRVEKVVSIMGTLPPHRLSFLSEEDCWLLFKQRAFGNGNKECPNLVAIGKDIAKKCGGVPLVATALGGLLRFQSEEKEWLSVKESEIWNLRQDGNPVLPVLKLSYYNLPLELRRCFSYCAFFPKGSKMEKGKLIRFWIANGYISCTDKRDPEDLGDSIWSQLSWRSFFQLLDESEAKDSRYLEPHGFEEKYKIRFKMHDLVHDLAQSIVEDERHLMEHRGSSDTGDRRVRQFSKEQYSPFERDKFDFRKFGSLRVFATLGISLVKLPSSIGKLKHLRYLDISYSPIRCLPDSICTLWNLQTLILYKCHQLKTLPNNMNTLKNLTHLCLLGCQLKGMPPEIGQLTSLKELSLFVVGKNKGCHLAELQHLNLGGALRIEHLERVKNPKDAKEANLVGKDNLRVLELIWECDYESESQENVEELLEALEPHPNLEKLVIENYYGTHLPRWMTDLKKIVHIELKNCKKCLQLPPFGQLPLLQRLVISRMGKVEYIYDDLPDGGPVRGFPSLKILEMYELSSLKGLSRKDGKELFPLLEKMNIGYCGSLSFRHLSSLKSLSVVGECTNVVLESISNLGSLTSLEVRDNREAICFPQEVLRNLTLLESLNIYSFTNLKWFPNDLANLGALKSLDIHSCPKLESLPEEGLRGLQSLNYLRFSSCEEFSSLSEGFQHLTALEYLLIYECPKLVALPEGVKHLKSLQRLNMYDNEVLPKTLQHVPALQSLEIWGYLTLTSLPDWLGNLTSLQSLDIRLCPKISSLLASIQRLTKLKRLSITYCSPKLARRCEKGKGEDWHKIAHVPEVEVPPPPVNVDPPAKPKVGILWGVDKEMKKMSSTLSSIVAVLEDAERNHLQDKAIQDWLRKLKLAAYEVEDVLDECSTEVLRRESTGQTSGTLEKAGTSLLYPFENLKFRHKIGNKMKEISENLAAIADERNKFHFRNIVAENRDEFTESRETSSFLTLPEVIGRNEDKEKIIKILLDDALERDEVSVYPIIGMGGLGKTTLVQAAFNDERMKIHFGPRIWVYVSEDFNLKRVIKSIIESISGDPYQVSDLDSAQRKLRELLNGKRYLIVLDDVWDEDQEKWDRLKYTLACGSKGSYVIVTTRVEKVVSITGTLPPHCLSYLSEDDCWMLFKQRAFGNGNEECPNLVPIGKDIAKKCGGVPLVATALGGLLRFQSEEKEWLSVKESEIWNLRQDGNPVLPVLKLSYYNLPLELRRCFAYCAFFPKGSKMEKGELIRLWMANGYISCTDKRDPEDLGDSIWRELCLRSFFQLLDKSESIWSVDHCKIWFKMHDLVHDLAQSIVEDERHMMEYRGSSGKGNGKVRQFAISMLREEDEAPQSPFQLDKCDLKKFGSLRVFEAGKTRIMKLSSSIGKLKHLRYLDISHNPQIRSLPYSICTLWNLQTLILDGCRRLKTLPDNMKCLKNLRHLHSLGCPLKEMPPEIRQLTSLKELSLFVMGKNKGCQLAELQHLNLGGALRIEHLERVKNLKDAKEANLVGKDNLRVLELIWECDDESESQANVEELLEALEPHPNLEKLVIENYYGTHLPRWMTNLKKIVHIELRNCKKCLQLPPFGQLPLLRRLVISRMDKVEYIYDDLPDGGPVRGFPSLKLLEMYGLSSLKGLSRKDGKELFPLLEEMKIRYCPSLSFRHLSSLKSLSVEGGCTNVVLESISNLESLTYLDVHDNREAIYFPEEVLRNLTLLESLKMRSFTNLKWFPNDFANLGALKSLDIMSCPKLESLPKEGLRGLQSLKYLGFYFCEEFSSLSEGFQHLTALEYLSIHGCPKLVALPEGVKHLKSLQRMFIIDNEVLPKTLQHVPALQSLDIWNYLTLTSLPDWLGNLTSLQWLSISRCSEISSLPTSIQRLTKLEHLSISYCSPELAQRCERGKGEDWHKIAHVPEVDVEVDPPVKPKAFCCLNR